jgi:hypothetical protein
MIATEAVTARKVKNNQEIGALFAHFRVCITPHLGTLTDKTAEIVE